MAFQKITKRKIKYICNDFNKFFEEPVVRMSKQFEGKEETNIVMDKCFPYLSPYCHPHPTKENYFVIDSKFSHFICVFKVNDEYVLEDGFLIIIHHKKENHKGPKQVKYVFVRSYDFNDTQMKIDKIMDLLVNPYLEKYILYAAEKYHKSKNKIKELVSPLHKDIQVAVSENIRDHKFEKFAHFQIPYENKNLFCLINPMEMLSSNQSVPFAIEWRVATLDVLKQTNSLMEVYQILFDNHIKHL